MSTYKLMEHERMRWATMTDKQLITRLGKITTMEKLECFARLCHENSDRYYLLQHVENRQRQLLGEVPGDWSVIPPKEVLRRAQEYFKENPVSIQRAKESFYEKVSGRKYSQPKPVAKDLRREKPETKVKSGERYLDF